jgi:hypothetical protein
VADKRAIANAQGWASEEPAGTDGEAAAELDVVANMK